MSTRYASISWLDQGTQTRNASPVALEEGESAILLGWQAVTESESQEHPTRMQVRIVTMWMITRPETP